MGFKVNINYQKSKEEYTENITNLHFKRIHLAMTDCNQSDLDNFNRFHF